MVRVQRSVGSIHTSEENRLVSNRWSQIRMVKLKSKLDSRLMLLLGAVLGPFFVTNMWTTVGRTVYFPSNVNDPEKHTTTLEHEAIHVKQYNSYGPLLWLLYLFFPLPIGFAYFRWRFEREAYLVQLREGASPELLADLLWRHYAWPWPKPWMERWFRRAKDKLPPSSKVVPVHR